MVFWRTFWRIFVRSPGAVPPYRPPLPLGFTAITDPPRREKSGRAVVRSLGATPVIIPIGFQSRAVASEWGGRFAVGLPLSLFLSGPLTPYWSRQVTEIGRLYSTVTHHTRNSRHAPGSSYLSLAGLSLLVRKWGPTLAHLVRDMPRCSRLV